jgi:zinc/manganese transport system substrate-binding protein
MTRTILGAALAVLMAACGGSNTTDAGTPSGGPIRVVAAENVYGDIVSQIGGDHVTVTSILSDPNADPHLYEPGTANGAAVAQARLVIVNGLGYDSFMEKLLAASPDASRKVVTIADVLHISGADANPHLWYDIPTIPDVAAAITDALVELDPKDRDSFQQGRSSFVASLKSLDDAVAELRRNDAGTPVAYTEPVPGYLLLAAGLKVETPEAFALAIEEGTDPTPQAVSEMDALFTDRRIKALLYNSQATSPITEQLLNLAKENGIPVVPVTETLPPGLSFQRWQLNQVQALSAALTA